MVLLVGILLVSSILIIDLIVYGVILCRKKYVLDVSQFNGSVLLHNPDISHLIEEHPGGFILGLNRKHFGENEKRC